MDIATQVSGDDLLLFIEDVSWKKLTLPFNNEKAKIHLAVFIASGNYVFHDAQSNLQPAANHPLEFCRELITVAEFKRKLKKAGFNEPSELRLAGERFEIRKEFTDAYTIIFRQWNNNPLLAEWLVRVFPVLETAKMLQRLKAGKRYCTDNFAEYAEFDSIDAFTAYRFEIWHKETVKEFEDALAKGKAQCDGCDI